MEETNNNIEQVIQFPQPNQPPEKQILIPFPKGKNIYKFLFFVSILILLVVVIISYLLIQTNNKQKINDSNQTLETTIIPTTKVKESTPTQTTVETPDAEKTGKDYSSAIIVTTNSEDTGVAWEYDWLKKNGCKENGGYSKPAGQALQSENDHMYDVITAVCNDKKEIDYYFMIDNFFGKF
jgi:hypothetical protein